MKDDGVEVDAARPTERAVIDVDLSEHFRIGEGRKVAGEGQMARQGEMGLLAGVEAQEKLVGQAEGIDIDLGVWGEPTQKEHI